MVRCIGSPYGFAWHEAWIELRFGDRFNFEEYPYV